MKKKTFEKDSLIATNEQWNFVVEKDDLIVINEQWKVASIIWSMFCWNPEVNWQICWE